jgi:hypothetical protein
MPRNPTTLFDLKNFFHPCLVPQFDCTATNLSDSQVLCRIGIKCGDRDARV